MAKQKQKFQFDPRWLRTLPHELTSDEIGRFLAWLDRNMGSMSAPDRDKAKRIHRELRVTLADRRSQQKRARTDRRKPKAGASDKSATIDMIREEMSRERHLRDI